MSQTKENIALLVGDPSVEFGRARLPGNLETDWTLREWLPADGPEAFAGCSRDADAVIGHGFGKLSLRDSAARLFQVPFAGYDWLRRERLPEHCTVCNTYEHESPIAEYVLLNVLEWEIGLRAIDADFRGGSWAYCMPAKGPYHGEALGKTLGLVGYGHIGREIATRAAAFGMRVAAVVPSERPCPEPLAWLGTTAEGLDRLLAESDYLVLTCPLNEHTRHLIGADQFARMKPSGVLINVARGLVAEEAALYQALAGRRIRGASIDTWYRYPFEPDHGPDTRPAAPEHPFHELDNLVMTPHCSAWTRELIDRRWAFVAANLDRFARGEALHNVLDI